MKTNIQEVTCETSGAVIPAKAGIHYKMDARLRSSGMTDKERGSVNIINRLSMRDGDGEVDWK
jgi:hypothetical protein